MRLLIDMNLTPVWVEFLAQQQIEAIHWSSVGPVTTADTQIMAYARSNGYTILTNDLDFGALLARTQAHGPSVILIRARILIPRTIGQTILAILREHRVAIETGALVTVDDYRHKLRLLPI